MADTTLKFNIDVDDANARKSIDSIPKLFANAKQQIKDVKLLEPVEQNLYQNLTLFEEYTTRLRNEFVGMFVDITKQSVDFAETTAQTAAAYKSLEYAALRLFAVLKEGFGSTTTQASFFIVSIHSIITELKKNQEAVEEFINKDSFLFVVPKAIVVLMKDVGESVKEIDKSLGELKFKDTLDFYSLVFAMFKDKATDSLISVGDSILSLTSNIGRFSEEISPTVSKIIGALTVLSFFIKGELLKSINLLRNSLILLQTAFVAFEAGEFFAGLLIWRDGTVSLNDIIQDFFSSFDSNLKKIDIRLSDIIKKNEEWAAFTLPTDYLVANDEALKKYNTSLNKALEYWYSIKELQKKQYEKEKIAHGETSLQAKAYINLIDKTNDKITELVEQQENLINVEKKRSEFVTNMLEAETDKRAASYRTMYDYQMKIINEGNLSEAEKEKEKQNIVEKIRQEMLGTFVDGLQLKEGALEQSAQNESYIIKKRYEEEIDLLAQVLDEKKQEIELRVVDQLELARSASEEYEIEKKAQEEISELYKVFKEKKVILENQLSQEIGEIQEESLSYTETLLDAATKNENTRLKDKLNKEIEVQRLYWAVQENDIEFFEARKKELIEKYDKKILEIRQSAENKLAELSIQSLEKIGISHKINLEQIEKDLKESIEKQSLIKEKELADLERQYQKELKLVGNNEEEKIKLTIKYYQAKLALDEKELLFKESKLKEALKIIELELELEKQKDEKKIKLAEEYKIQLAKIETEKTKLQIQGLKDKEQIEKDISEQKENALKLSLQHIQKELDYNIQASSDKIAVFERANKEIERNQWLSEETKLQMIKSNLIAIEEIKKKEIKINIAAIEEELRALEDAKAKGVVIDESKFNELRKNLKQYNTDYKNALDAQEDIQKDSATKTTKTYQDQLNDRNAAIEKSNKEWEENAKKTIDALNSMYAAVDKTALAMEMTLASAVRGIESLTGFYARAFINTPYNKAMIEIYNSFGKLEEEANKLGIALDTAKYSFGRLFEQMQAKKQAISDFGDSLKDLAQSVKEALKIDIEIDTTNMKSFETLLNNIKRASVTTMSELEAYFSKTTDMTLEEAQKMAADTMNTYKALVDKLKEKLNELEDEWQKLADKVKEISQEILDINQDVADKIKELNRQNMSDYQVYQDKMLEYNGLMAKAELANKQKDYELAAQSHKQALAIAEGLTGEIKDGDKVVLSLKDSIEAAIKLMQSAQEGANAALTRQQKLLEEQMDKTNGKIQDTNYELGKIGKEADSVANKINYALGNIDSKGLAKLTDSWGRDFYSAVAPKQFSTGGLVSGQDTGKDSILSLLRPGEFVIKNEAVNHYGPGFLNALNTKQLQSAFANNSNTIASPSKEMTLKLDLTNKFEQITTSGRFTESDANNFINFLKKAKRSAV